MDDGAVFLQSSQTVVVIDWPTRDVPDSLAIAGYTVFVKSGPGDDDYTAHELVDGVVMLRPLGRRPERADIVYIYRPPAELARHIETAAALVARAIWIQSALGSSGAPDPHGCWMPPERSSAGRSAVEAAGMTYLERPYIGDAARASPRAPRP